MKLPWILLVLILAVGLRLPQLNSSFWLDEAAQALESARPFSQQLDITPDFQPPLLHFIVHFATRINHTEWWLRTIGALIPGLISIYFTFKIGQKLNGEKLGILASLLVATSNLHIFYSQELRPYALPCAIALSSWWCLLNAIETKSPTSKWWWGLGILSGLGLYSSYVYPFLLLGQLSWLGLARPTQWRSGVVAIVIGIGCFLPWLPSLRLQLAAGSEVRQSLPGWSSVVSLPQLKALPLVGAKFIFGIMDVEFSWPFVTALMGVIGLSLVSLGTQPRHFSELLKKKHRFSLVFLGCWLLVPLFSAWIVSFWIPVIQPKRVLFLLPAFYLLLSWISLHARVRWIGTGLIALLIAINIWGFWNYQTNPKLHRENWRAAQAYLVEKYQADRSVAVFVFPEPLAPWRWYVDSTYPTWTTQALHINQVPNLNEQLSHLRSYRYIIVFDYLRDLTDPNNLILSGIQDQGYQINEIVDYPNIGFIRIYERRH